MATRDRGLHQLTDDERDGEDRARGEAETRETVKGIEGSPRTELKELEEVRRGLAEEFELQERDLQDLGEQTASSTILSSLVRVVDPVSVVVTERVPQHRLTARRKGGSARRSGRHWKQVW